MTVDAWEVANPCACPECGRESCEEHLPAPELTAAPDVEVDDCERHVQKEISRLRIAREARRRLDAEERGTTINPEIVTLADLVAEPEPNIAYRIEGWQRVDTRVLLAAPRKAGKTTLIGSLVRSLVDGEEWLGSAAVVPILGAVAIIDTEMSRAQLRAWLKAQRVRHPERVFIIPVRGQTASLDLLDPVCRARWQVELQARDVHYLILDCLRPVLDALGLDESREAGRYLVGIDALLREAGIPEACVVHHMGHVGERSRGDSRLRDWPDAEWRVLRRKDDEDDSPRFISAYGRDVDVPEAELAFDSITRRVKLVGGTRSESRAKGVLETVLKLLQGTADLSGRQVKAKLKDCGLSKDAIDGALQLGVSSGRLVATDGPRNARLYRASDRPGVSGQRPADTVGEGVSECPTASIEAVTRDTHGLPPNGNQLQPTQPVPGHCECPYD